MPKPVPYEKLNGGRKLELANSSLDMIMCFNPKLLENVSTDKEFFERLIEFSKTLYGYFPNFKRKPAVAFAEMKGH